MKKLRCILEIKDNGILIREMDYEIMKELVYALVSLIPIGHVVTYKDLANILRISPRIIGKILSENSLPIAIPCHRVIRSDGRLGGYTIYNKRNDYFKYKLLKFESFGTTPSRYNLHRVLGL